MFGQHDPDRLLTAVAISPDLGERYLNAVYNDDWVTEHIGPTRSSPLSWAEAADRVGDSAHAGEDLPGEQLIRELHVVGVLHCGHHCDIAQGVHAGIPKVGVHR